MSLDPVAKAADTTSQQRSEHMTLTATAVTGTQVVTMAGEGDFRNSPSLGRLTMVVSGPERAAMEAVVRGTTVFMTSDLFRGKLPGGKTWLAIDYAKTAKSLGVDLGSWSSQSPADTLAALRASGSTVTRIGPAMIGGVATTHYSAFLDPSRAAKLTKAIGVTVTYAPVDVWVDAQGLVRRVHMAYVQGGSGTLPQSSMQMTMTLSRYGEAVRVAVPPTWATYDATDLARLLKR